MSNFIHEIAPLVQKYCNKYGYKFASVVIAQACYESAHGTSELATKAHNYFGLKHRGARVSVALPEPYYKDAAEQNADGSYRIVKGDAWYAFENMEKSVEGYFQFISISNYNKVREAKTFQEAIYALRDAKYWTSLDYDKRLINFIEKNNLTQYDVKTQPVTNLYFIEKGDTLWGISKKYGCTVEDICKLNNMKPTDIIKPGDVLNMTGYRVCGNVNQKTVAGDNTTIIINVDDSTDIDIIAIDFKNRNSTPRTERITKITPHHMAGNMDAEACAIYHRDKTQVSANYYIGTDGKIVLGVPENRRAYTSSSKENDMQAITIEVANSSKAPNWTISAKAYESLVKLCVYICKKYQFVPHYTGDKFGSLTMHKMFKNTACPGPYLENIITSGKLEDDVMKIIRPYLYEDDTIDYGSNNDEITYDNNVTEDVIEQATYKTMKRPNGFIVMV